MVESTFEKMIELNTDLYNSGIVSWFLYRYYGLNPNEDPNIYRLDRQPYHIYVKPEWAVLMEPNRVLKKPLNEDVYERLDDKSLNSKQQDYIFDLEEDRGEQKNRQTFRLMKIDELQDGIKLHCGLGCYYDYLCTCEILADELFYQLRSEPREELKLLTDVGQWDKCSDLFERIKQKLLARNLLAPDIQSVNDYTLRDSKIGINVFTVLNHPINPICWLYHRAKKIGEYPNIYHVIPAGTFQHDSERNDLSCEETEIAFDIQYKVLSEFWEECLEGEDMGSEGMAEGFNVRKDLSSLVVKEKEKLLYPIRDLMVHLSDNKAFIYVTGLGIDLLAAKPELTVLLVVNDFKFADKYENHWDFNWEVHGETPKERKKWVKPISLTQNGLGTIKELISPGRCIPAGAMAVKRGLSVLSKLRSERWIDFEVPDWSG